MFLLCSTWTLQISLTHLRGYLEARGVPAGVRAQKERKEESWWNIPSATFQNQELKWAEEWHRTFHPSGSSSHHLWDSAGRINLVLDDIHSYAIGHGPLILMPTTTTSLSVRSSLNLS